MQIFLYFFNIYKVTCGLGDHHRRSLGHLWAFCGLSVAVLGRSQVGFRLRDHFATTVADLLPKCVLSVAFLVSLFSFPFSEDHRPLAEGIKTAQEERVKKTSADIPART